MDKGSESPNARTRKHLRARGSGCQTQPVQRARISHITPKGEVAARHRTAWTRRNVTAANIIGDRDDPAVGTVTRDVKHVSR